MMSDVLIRETSSGTLAGEPAAGGLSTPRSLGRADGDEPGPTLILVGGLHGNEPAGVLGLQRIFERLEKGSVRLTRGRALGFAGNRQALLQRKRFLTDDLNRSWHPERVEKLRTVDGPLQDEDLELRELHREIEQARAESPAGMPVFLLDLHTTSGPGGAFVNLDDNLQNRSFALEFPVPVVLGLEEELSGTLTSYFGDEGLVAAGFEAGQHDDPTAIDRAEAAIWIALEVSGLLEAGAWPEVDAARDFLSREHAHLPAVVEVRYRHGITGEDWFRMDPGYLSFQEVQKDQNLALDRNGPVLAPVSGRILMPLYQRLGSDGFFIVRSVHPAWLELSALVRRWHLERFLHLLPGVRKHPEKENHFIADRRYARFLALELFHLLGFRREGQVGDRYLEMSRRLNDRD